MTTVLARPHALVAVALRRRETSTGLGWRLAREVDNSVVRQVAEADVGGNVVVVVFEAVGAGKASVVFALTRGESSPDVLQALTYNVDVIAS